MSKKQDAINATVNQQLIKAENKIVDGAVQREEKNKKIDNKTKAKKKEKKQSKIAKTTKETVSELKKVTWPTFGEVVKKTGIVIAFVVIFGLFIYGVNTLLAWLTGLLV